MDPMCGTGTIPLEAALMARRIAPGFARSFAFERFHIHDAKRWAQLREAARLKQRKEIPVAIYASDHDASAVKTAQRLFQGAGRNRCSSSSAGGIVARASRPQRSAIDDAADGVRLGNAHELETFYPQWGTG